MKANMAVPDSPILIPDSCKLSPDRIFWHMTMAELSTLRVGGPVGAVIYPESERELLDLTAALNKIFVPWRVIGQGSNILASDDGFAGVVIVLGRNFSGIKRLAQGRISAQAGCSLGKLTAWCAGQGLSGLEFAVGIPGTVGGAIRMNAGAWGRAMADVTAAVRLINHHGECYEQSLTAGDFTYRAWRQSTAEVISAGVFHLAEGLPDDILVRGRELLRARRVKQPKGVASAGSFFKNPPGEAAGRLIEQAGLKGVDNRRGPVVSESFMPIFWLIMARPVPGSFFALMRLIQDKVQGKFGVKLEPEVEFM